MRLLLIAARKDLRRRLADVPALMIWFGIPLAIGCLLFLVSGGGPGRAAPRATVLLVDLDRSFLSGLVATGASGGRLGEFLDVQRVEPDAGERRMAAGEASALLVIPKGFGDAVLNETPAEIRLVTNPAHRIVPGLVQEGLEILIEGAFYAQRVVGEPFGASGVTGAEAPQTEQVAAMAATIHERLRTIGGVVFPPALSVVTQTAPAAQPGPSVGLLIVPGILLMAALFVAQGTSGDLWAEKQAGTLRRARALPAPIWLFLAGKLLAGSVLIAGAVVVGLVVAWTLFDVPAIRLSAALVWTWCAGASLLCYFALLQTLAATERGAQLTETLVLFPLMMVGGSLFPFDVMPSWLAAIGRWTPNGLSVVRLREILDGRAEMVPLLASLTAIAVPAMVAFWLAARRLAGRFPVH